MLFTYTLDEPTEETIEQVKNAVVSVTQYNNNIVWPKKPGGDFLFSFTTSWCRELAVGQLLSMIGPLPPGKLNIYGIRKHSESWGNQPRDIRGEISKPDKWINSLFTNLFQFMTEMFSHALGTGQPFHLHDAYFWLTQLGRNNLGRLGVASVDSPMKWLLNVNEETIPDTHLWKSGAMYGTMYNIPSEWARSQATMSYLLYLLRVWGAFYESDDILMRLSRLGRLKYNGEFLSGLCCEVRTGETCRSDGPLELWRHIAKRLILPMWFTEYGGQAFWIFTYLVIREGMAVREGLPRIPGFQEALTTMKCSGFMSWLRQYKCKSEHGAPGWVKDLSSAMQESGPFVALKRRAVITYI